VTGQAERKPSAAEETYIHLLSRLIFRARVSFIPGVQEVLHDRLENVEAVQGDVEEEKETVVEEAKEDALEEEE
jgi:hypothetical protein